MVASAPEKPAEIVPPPVIQESRGAQSARSYWEQKAHRQFSPRPNRGNAAAGTRGVVRDSAQATTPSRPQSAVKQAGYFAAEETPAPDPAWGWEEPSFSECPAPACGPICTPCPSTFWLREEYILWWGKGDNLPSLVTTSPAGTDQDVAGVLDEPTTTTLFGGGLVNAGSRSGIRDRVGYWFDEEHRWGVEGTYFIQSGVTASFQAATPFPEILARPYMDVTTGQQSAFLVSFPGVRNGAIDVRETNEIEGAEFLLRRNFFRDCGGRADLLVGYRYARLGDSLSINQTSTALVDEGPDAAGITRTVSDAFNTVNEFSGGELGMIAQWQGNPWSLELLMKVALGNTSSRADISGTTTLSGDPDPLQGGLLAQPTNIGPRKLHQFTMMPELGITLARDLAPRARATVGYTLIYWSKVTRPGDLLDLNVNPTQVPPGTLDGAPQPQFTFASNDYWIHGLNVGLEYQF